jgi:anti-anti-sigma factor
VDDKPDRDRPVADFEVQRDVVLVRAHGEIDMMTEPDLRWALHEAVDTAQHRTVIIDVTGVEFFASTGVSAVAEAFADGRGRGVDVCLVVRPGTGVHRALELMGLTGLIPSYDTVDAARRGQTDSEGPAGSDAPEGGSASQPAVT